MFTFFSRGNVIDKSGVNARLVEDETGDGNPLPIADAIVGMSKSSIPRTQSIALEESEPTFRYANFWQRLIAVAIDELNLGIISTLVLAISCLPMIFAFAGPYYKTASPVGFSFTPAGVAGVMLSGGLILLFLPWLYTALYESSPWQSTPGKRMLRLVVKEPDGSKCSFWRSTYKLSIQTICVLVLTCAVGIALSWLDSIFIGSTLYEMFPADLRFWYRLVMVPLIQFFATITFLCVILFRGKQTLIDKISGRIIVCETEEPQTSQQGPFKTPGNAWRSVINWLRSTFTQFTLLFALCSLPLITGLIFTAGDLWRKLDKVTSGSALAETLPASEMKPGLFESISGLYFIRYLIAESQSQFDLPEAANGVERTLPGFSRFYADANGVIGDALYRVGKQSSAMSFYAHALSINPHEEHYATRWAELAQPRTGTRPLESSFASPIVAINSTVERSPASVLYESDSLQKAVEYAVTGNRELAKQRLMLIKPDDPDNFKAKQLSIYIDLENSHYNAALESARKLHKLAPSSSSPYAFAANTHTLQGFPKSALPLALSAVEADPKSSYARAALADAACLLGLHEFAKSQALLAIKFNPNEPEGNLQLAHLYRLQSQLINAKKEVDIALALNPGSPFAHQERYEIERRLGDFSDVAADLAYLNDIGYRPRMSLGSATSSPYSGVMPDWLSSVVDGLFKFKQLLFH